MLRVVQPALVGMIDGTVSSLARIFAAALSSDSRTAFLVGIATALGAGVSMGCRRSFGNGRRDGPWVRSGPGADHRRDDDLGGIFDTLLFLISDVHTALLVAGGVVAVERV